MASASGPAVSDRPEESLAALVRRAQAGDDGAFQRLVERCHERVFRWALMRTGDPDDADDVAQEVAVQLYRRLDSYRGDAAFSTWLYRVTRNAATQFGRWRRRVRGKVVPLHDGLAIEESSRLDLLYESEFRGVVRALFEELPGRQRVVFDLADLQGMPPAEIAELLGMKPVTVRAHLHKARRAIRRKILEKHPEMVEDR